MALNSFIRGWCHYYRCTSSPAQIFGKLNPEVFWGMAHWLGRKYQISMPRVMKKFRQGNSFGMKNITLIMPSDINARKRLVKAWHNPYTAKEAIIREQVLWYERLWTGNEDREGWSDLREKAILLKGTICAMNSPDCESKRKPLHPSEVIVDHIIPRAKFKDPKEGVAPHQIVVR
jgi:hypothetical protein